MGMPATNTSLSSQNTAHVRQTSIRRSKAQEVIRRRATSSLCGSPAVKPSSNKSTLNELLQEMNVGLNYQRVSMDRLSKEFAL